MSKATFTPAVTETIVVSEAKIVLELTPAEAAAILSLTRCVSGYPSGTVRSLTDAVGGALQSAKVPYVNSLGGHVDGSMLLSGFLASTGLSSE